MNKLLSQRSVWRFCSVNRRFQEGKLVDPRQGSLSLSCSLNSYIVVANRLPTLATNNGRGKARFLDHDRRDDTTSTSVSSVSRNCLSRVLELSHAVYRQD